MEPKTELMNQAHLHLLLNHIPILGSLFGLCLLAYGLFRKNRPVENAGLATLVVVALATIPAFLTGEGAEEAVERLPGVSSYFKHEHEELAEVAFWCMEAVGALALLSLLLSALGKAKSRLLTIGTLLAAAVTFGIMVKVGNDGGKIRHSEIRTAADAAEARAAEDRRGRRENREEHKED